MKRRGALRILIDCIIPIKLKKIFSKTIIRPICFMVLHWWAIKKQHVHKISVTKMRQLRLISGDIYIYIYNLKFKIKKFN